MNDPAVRITTAMILALDATHDFEDGEAKFLLWNTLLAACTKIDYCREVVQAQKYLDSILHLFRVQEGVCVYTVRQGQVNLNVVVPRVATDVQGLVQQVLAHFSRAYEGYAVDISALHSYMAFVNLPDICVRRFVGARKHVRDLAYDPATQTLSLLGATQPVAGVLHHAADVQNFKPLTRLHEDDADDTVYWHRTPDGTLVTLTNPHQDPVEPLPFPPSVPLETVLGSMPPHIQHVLASMCRDTAEDVMRAADPAWVPNSLRRVLVEVAQRRFGIHDEILLQAQDLFHKHVVHTQLILEMCIMGDVLHGCIEKRIMDASKALEKVCRAMEHFDHKLQWVRWFFESPFVFSCVQALTVSGLRRALKHHPKCRPVALNVLKYRLGEWTCGDVAKAKVLVEDGESVPAFVAEELERQTERSERAAQDVFEEGSISKPPPPKGRRAPPPRRRNDAMHATKKEDDESLPIATTPTTVPRETTHAERVLRLADAYGLTLELIGSGVFLDASDADVVVTVDATTLADAYEHVRARTGWTPTYERVPPEDRVVTLRGTFEGVLVDAQVWRGSDGATTPAEEETRRALALTRRLSAEADAGAKEHVRALHSWAHAAGLKGHRWCRLPGVAVTCVAIVLSTTRDARSPLARLLEALRDVLRHDSPALDFTEQTSTERALPHHRVRRPLMPFAVRVDEHNLATRLTRATTCHLLDCVACALDTADTRLCASAVYADWRKQHMLPCARLKPRHTRAVLQTLYASLMRLDGHPLIDSLHVEEEEQNTLCVHVTLDASADARTYGFRDDDRLVACEDGARVHRGTRVCGLVAVRRPPTVRAWAERGSVRDLLALDDERSVPNAPFLSVDVLLCFDHQHWEAL